MEKEEALTSHDQKPAENSGVSHTKSFFYPLSRKLIHANGKDIVSD